MTTIWLAWGPLLGWTACTGADGPIRSVQTEPTVQFDDGAAKEAEIVWTDLETLFPERPAALPESLSALQPGMVGAEARKILEDAHEPGAKIFGDTPDGDTLALSTILRGENRAQITLVLGKNGRELSEVHVSLPDEVAIPMLSTRWGEAVEVEHLDGGKARYRWEGPDSPWSATLYPEPGGAATVQFKAKPTR